MDILIFSGQSNMQGQTEVLSENEAVNDALEYKYLTDTFSPVKNPVGEDIRFDGTAGYPVMPETDLSVWHSNNVLGSSCYGNTNMVPSFCRAYVKASGRKVIAVHAAKGSTVISDWLPGTKIYGALKDKSLAAIAKAKQSYEIDYIFLIWLQGESDAIEGCTKEKYKTELKTLAEGLKKDVGITRFCVIQVGRFANDERDFEIMNAQSEICLDDPDFVMLTDKAASMNEEEKYMNPFVVGHFSALGQEKLGELSGNALANVKAN